MTSFRTIMASAGGVATALLMSACGDGGVQDVQQWMNQEKAQAPVTVQKISPPKKFTPFTYGGKDSPDPFSSIKLAAALAKLQANANGAIKPDLDRQRDPLENYPLDNIKMVGTLQKPGLSYALLQVDRSVFQVKVGSYIGQNFGMVTKITDTEVLLTEIVRDASGEWSKRNAKLELQEK